MHVGDRPVKSRGTKHGLKYKKTTLYTCTTETWQKGRQEDCSTSVAYNCHATDVDFLSFFRHVSIVGKSSCASFPAFFPYFLQVQPKMLLILFRKCLPPQADHINIHLSFTKANLWLGALAKIAESDWMQRHHQGRKKSNRKLQIVLIPHVKSLSYNNSILIVDSTVHPAPINCTYLFTRSLTQI